MAKATNFEAKKRLNTVYNMLLLGVSRADIVQYSIDNWAISEPQTDVYIAKANALFAEKAAPIRDEQFGLALERLQNLYQKNMKIQDYKAALATQKEISELLGLYPAKKQELTGANGGAIKLDATLRWEDLMNAGDTPENNEDPDPFA